ncbi:MAG: six-cysteine peptide SCIFF [Clostridiaceae bacterium]|jgi:predicted ribosomally synthesized six-cysteine peptide SCIFF|nr:six-cysteine peptide SCIFF [Clostridiaceae bacterium]
MKYIKTIQNKTKLSSKDGKACGECQTSCQSACKTSCTVANQPCEKRDTQD